MSYSPHRMSFAAYITDLRPDPHTLLTVTAPAETGMPAPMPAWRAGACPMAACSTLPMMTCWIASGCTREFSRAHLMAIEPSFGAGSPESVPRNEPIGVRAPPRITVSFIGSPLGSGLRFALCSTTGRNFYDREQSANQRPDP